MEGGAAFTIARLSGDAGLDEVAALEAASFSNPWSRDLLARELQNTNVSRVYVMHDSAGRLMAFCACWLVADELHINTLAVQQDERRRGHATRLLRFVFKEALAEGARAATLEVRRSNHAALVEKPGSPTPVLAVTSSKRPPPALRYKRFGPSAVTYKSTSPSLS